MKAVDYEKKEEKDTVKQQRKRELTTAAVIFAAWILIGLLIRWIVKSYKYLEYEITAERTIIFGLEISISVIYVWVAMAVILAAAVIIRILLIGKMKDKPGRIQNLIEIIFSGGSMHKKQKEGINVAGGFSFILFIFVLMSLTCLIAGLLGAGVLPVYITGLISLAAVAFIFLLVSLFIKIYKKIRENAVNKRVLKSDKSESSDIIVEETGSAGAKDPVKQLKKRKRTIIVLAVIAAWFIIGQLITLIFGKPEAEALEVEIAAGRLNFFGLDLSITIICSWIAMLIIIVAAILIRIFVIPKLKDTPKGIQAVLEVAVDGISDYTQKQAGHLGDNLSAYIFTIAVFMVSSAIVELFGFRAPTADITVTAAMAIMTFVLINYYGFKQKGVAGRLKSLMSPSPVIFPMKVISELAVPISLACRLFGNMLGGMIVIDLLYMALGNSSLLIPSVLGLYFNIAHPLLQTYIFITLSLTFIREAAEDIA